MLGVIHRAVLGEGPPQIRSFFVLDNSGLRRCERHVRHNLQLSYQFGSRPLDMLKRSVLGLSRVYNLLLASIVSCNRVNAFQGALQYLLCSQAMAAKPNWQDLLSPR